MPTEYPWRRGREPNIREEYPSLTSGKGGYCCSQWLFKRGVLLIKW
jgi:hypothetical protein